MIAKSNTICFLVTILAASVLTHGCTDQEFDAPQAEEVVTFPLIKECEEAVTSALTKFTKKGISRFEYKIDKFSIPVLSHPSIIGVVTIKSAEMGQRQLVMLANNPITTCYPNASFSLSVIDEDFGDKLRNEYQINRRMGISKYYIYVNGDELISYFRDPSIAPSLSSD